MELKIKKIRDVFYLTGYLNSKTVSLFRNYFNYTFDLGSIIILNFENLKEIDTTGKLVLEELYDDCLSSNQQLCITGFRFDSLIDDLGDVA